jgi:isohexenylglutaconyl-CoA hydratase
VHLPDCSCLALRLDDGAAYATLDRPAARNALSRELVAELRKVLAAVAHRREVRAIVLRGAGDAFCAGGDVKEMRSLLRASPRADPDERRRRLVETSRAFGLLLAELDRAPQVVIAAVEGPAMGGGLGLVCAADVVLATGEARFGLPETTLGLVPAQIAPFIVRRLGPARARRFVATGAVVGAREAREIGLVDHVAADAEALDARLAKVLHDVRRCAPHAVAATKELLRTAGAADPARFVEQAAGVFADALLGEEGQEGLHAFAARRPPRWAPAKDE